jgi:4-hydroxy-tetrahydrodipicolinate reductase
VEEIAKKGLSIVTTCEELAFPWKTQPAFAKKLDQICKKRKVALLGTGVNPGYLMDFLPTALTAVAQKVNTIKVSRVQDASIRRIPFQQKIGAGLTVDQFRQKEKEGTLRHVGLPESMDYIAARMGWKLTQKSQSLEPVMAETEVTSGYTPIHSGMARGVEQVGRGYMGDKEVITLYFKAAVGEPRSFDKIEVTGEPAISCTIEGGVNGDIATCAITLNSIHSVLASAPGLRTMADVIPVAYSE